MLNCKFSAVASIAKDGFALDELGCNTSANLDCQGWFE